MNIKKVGIVYHVIDKDTGETIKVGSTIQTLKQRFNSAYKKVHSNHFLREVMSIESSDIDWYIKGDYYCPFLWHLAAAEHIEMLKADTYRKGPLSNKQSPLDQKCRGFDGSIAGKIGGAIGGKIGGKISGKFAVDSGRLAAIRTPEHQRKAGKVGGQVSVERQIGIHYPDFDHSINGRKNGRANVESGHIYKISTPESCLRGGITQGKKNAESGHMSRVSKAVSFEVRSERGKIVGPRAMHVRWHINRGIVKPDCKFCNIGVVNEKDNCLRRETRRDESE